MNVSHLLGQRSSGNKIATVVGLTALAGVALVCAIPKTRRACNSWLGNVVDDVKERIADAKKSPDEKSWEQDLANAEKLKGPMKNRKDATAIKVPSAGTTAWKDEWSSE